MKPAFTDTRHPLSAREHGLINASYRVSLSKGNTRKLNGKVSERELRGNDPPLTKWPETFFFILPSLHGRACAFSVRAYFAVFDANGEIQSRWMSLATQISEKRKWRHKEAEMLWPPFQLYFTVTSRMPPFFGRKNSLVSSKFVFCGEIKTSREIGERGQLYRHRKRCAAAANQNNKHGKLLLMWLAFVEVHTHELNCVCSVAWSGLVSVRSWDRSAFML